MPRKLLVWETHHLGDAVMSGPFIRAAAEHFEVTLVCRPSQVEIYRLLLSKPFSIIEWEPFWVEKTSKRTSLISLTKLLLHLRSFHFDYALSVWADFRIHLLLFLSNAKIRIGLPMSPINFYASHLSWRKVQLARSIKIADLCEWLIRKPLLTKQISREANWSHLDAWSALAQSAGFPPKLETPWFSTSTVNSSITDFLARARADLSPIWIIHHGARTPNRRWPLEKYSQIIDDILLPHGCTILLFDQNQKELFCEKNTRFGTFNTPTLTDLISLVGRGDHLFCNDSLCAHIGAAMGLEVWTVFSSGDITLFSPFGNTDRVLAKDICEFRPCLDKCMKPSYICLDGIETDYVKNRILQSFSDLNAK
jgi:ADP-heptose:LPS heptosyltransferase